MVVETVTIPGRFCGPPGVGNGGYVSGVLAKALGGTVVVKLRAPAPLDKPLQLERGEGGAKLRDGDMLVAEAIRAELDIDVPAPPPFEVAERTLQQFRGYDKHLFPGCFACGPKRPPGDGLRVFALPVPQTQAKLVAAWTPDAAFAGAGGELPSEYLWSALDCPGGFTVSYAEGNAILTGEILGRVERTLRAGERCLVIAWPISSVGRKHYAGSAIFTAAAERVAVARSLWIEVPGRKAA